MTDVVERSLSQSQILNAVKTKIQQCLKILLMVFRDEMMDYEGGLK